MTTQNNCPINGPSNNNPTERSPSPADLVTTETGEPTGSKTTDATCGKPKNRQPHAASLDKLTRALMQALSGLNSPEEKIAALCKRYADLMQEHRELQTSLKGLDKQYAQVSKEKERLQGDHSKAVLGRSKLENLCRELQKQNRQVKEDSVVRAREEEERRKEISNHFKQTLGDVQKQMEDNTEKNNQLRDENRQLAEKLTSLIGQYEHRDKQVQELMNARDLEYQLAEAKFSKAQALLNEERTRALKERETLLTDNLAARRQNDEFMATEVVLKKQLLIYADKFEEFQSTLTKSNEIFVTFKGEMDKMTKRIQRLEKETALWRSRWEACNRSLLEMAEERQLRETELTTANARVATLEKLCRAMQEERGKLNEEIKCMRERGEAASGETGKKPEGKDDTSGVERENTDEETSDIPGENITGKGDNRSGENNDLPENNMDIPRKNESTSRQYIPEGDNIPLEQEEEVAETQTADGVVTTDSKEDVNADKPTLER